MSDPVARKRLIALLRLAHAGERAAALAYAGHWRSVRDHEEQAAIARVEREEWDHRACLAGMLAGLGAAPSRLREPMMAAVGRVLGLLCHVSGWLAPMYGAGWIERRNVWEYIVAARHARDAGEAALVEPLLAMAEVEHDHEAYFRAKVRSHRLARWIPMWASLPAKVALREGFSPAGSPAAA
jgi:demethoxyubiquinone hydroxylase (CLK1/Coq7/Cat5 family)